MAYGAEGSETFTATLKAGAGSCTLKSTALKAGKYSVTAAFPGDLDFARSATTAKVLTVLK